MEHRLPRELRVQMRTYLQQAVYVSRSRAQHELLASMTPALRAEAVWRSYNRWLLSMKCLRGVERAFLVKLALQMQPAVLTQSELVPSVATSQMLYVLQVS